MTKESRGHIWFWIGLVPVLFSVIPYLILGQDAIYTYHDQLDGEMIAYILQARHFLSGDILPEFMGGMGKTALTMPAPAGVILFLGGYYATALLILQLMGKIVGFVGMYLLARDAGGISWIAAMVGVLYSFLPFMPVYGLTQYGIPLLIWCFLQLQRNKHVVLSYCYVALFAFMSSLVLAGFGLLGMGIIFLGYQVWRCRTKRAERGEFLRPGAAWLLLTSIYVAENFRLLTQILAGGEISHKAECSLHAEPFWGGFLHKLLEGADYYQGYQGLLAICVPVAVVCCLGFFLVWQRRHVEELQCKEIRGDLRRMGVCLGCNVLLTIVATLWSTWFVVGIRARLGALGAFQLDRVMWMTPCLWYLAFACGIAVIWKLWKAGKEIGLRLVAGICLVCLFFAVGVTGVKIFMAGDLKSNIQKLRNPDYGLLSFREYYAIGVMEQVKDFLEEQTGKSQAEYRVVSLGIDPAAALYHGFYCLDGYSNNYSLDYKHRFREVIAPELEKSDWLRDYYDNWGNRCYLFSAECPGYYTIEKGGFYFQEYTLNTEALKGMGCDYVFSAAYIQNAPSQGLRLMCETPFATPDSYYGIWVYEIED